jgi:hypothetical protein
MPLPKVLENPNNLKKEYNDTSFQFAKNVQRNQCA